MIPKDVFNGLRVEGWRVPGLGFRVYGAGLTDLSICQEDEA